MRARPRSINVIAIIACAATASCLENEDDTEAPLEQELGDESDDGWVTPVRWTSSLAVGESVAVDEYGGPVSLPVVPGRVSSIPSRELEERRMERGVHEAERPGTNERTLVRLSERDPAERVTLLVTVEGPGFDFSQLRGLDEVERGDLINERRDTLALAQAAAEPELERIGATIVARRWLSSRVIVEVAAGRAAEIASLDGVKSIALDDVASPSWAADGTDLRDQMLVGEMIDAGYDSMQGGRYTGGRVRIAFIEAGAGSGNWPTVDHVGWLTWPNGATRLRTVESCTFFGCSPTTASANGVTHGNTVMWAAAGDYTDGQDPSLPPPGGGGLQPPDPEEQRSGAAVEAWMYYYGHDSCSGMEAALEDAVASGVDVVNISSGIAAGQCDPSYDCMNSAIRAAFDAGVVVVAAAGNGGHAGGCTVDYPALRPEVVSVGQLDSENVYTPIFGNLYFDMRLGDNSSKGPVPIQLRSGLSRDMAGIDVVAMGKFRHYYTSAPNGTTTLEMEGSSLSAGVVSGHVANMRDMFDSIGWSAATNAGAAIINLMLVSDRWNGVDFDDTPRGVSDYSGFGRVWARWPSSTSLTGPWGWGWRSFNLEQGESFAWTVGGSGPESGNVTQWKWAVTWFDSDLEAASDVVIDVYDTCPPGGGEVRVDQDWSYDPRKAVHLLEEDIGGKCLEMRAQAFQAPPGGVRVFSADYYHGDFATTLH